MNIFGHISDLMKICAIRLIEHRNFPIFDLFIRPGDCHSRDVPSLARPPASKQQSKSSRHAVGYGKPDEGIAFKVGSVVVFLAMQTFIKLAGSDIQPGQVTFCRSFFALFPIMAYLAYRGQLRSAFYTANPIGHLKRGTLGIISMGLGFYGLLHLPLPEAIALGYAMPLVAVIFAAVFLGETVRIYRWSAVLFGIVGVAIISWPKLTLSVRAGSMPSRRLAR